MIGDENELQWKRAVIETLKRIPIYRYAAKIQGVSEDTLLNRRNADEEFSVRCEAAKAEGLVKFMHRASPEFILTHADPEFFKDVKKLEVSGDPLVIIKNGDTSK